MNEFKDSAEALALAKRLSLSDGKWNGLKGLAISTGILSLLISGSRLATSVAFDYFPAGDHTLLDPVILGWAGMSAACMFLAYVTGIRARRVAEIANDRFLKTTWLLPGGAEGKVIKVKKHGLKLKLALKDGSTASFKLKNLSVPASPAPAVENIAA
jgi:hypothetical protein